MSSEAGSAGAAEHIGFFKDKADRRFNYDEADRGSDSGDTASIHQLDVDFRIPQNTDAATVLAFIPELTERIATASLSEMKELQKYVLKAFEMNLNIEEAVAAEYATPEVVRAETASNLSNEDTTPVGSVQIARDTSGSRALYTIFEAPEAIVAAETLEKNVLWTLAEDTANFSAAEPTMMPPPPLPTGNISEATASMTPAHVALRNSIRLARNFFPTTSDSSSPRRILPRRRRRRSPNDFRMLWQRIFADIGELSANCGSIDAISYQPLSRLPDDVNPSRVRYVPAAEGVSSWQLPRQPIGASSSLSQVLPIEMGMSAPTMQNNEPISVYDELPSMLAPLCSSTSIEVPMPSKLLPPVQTDELPTDFMDIAQEANAAIEVPTTSKQVLPELPTDFMDIAQEASMQPLLDRIVKPVEDVMLTSPPANDATPTGSSHGRMNVSPDETPAQALEPLAEQRIAAYMDCLRGVDGVGYRNWYVSLRDRYVEPNYAGMQAVNPPRPVRGRRRRRRRQQQDEPPQLSPLQIIGVLPTSSPQVEGVSATPRTHRSPVHIISVEHLPQVVRNSPSGSANIALEVPALPWPRFLTDNLSSLSQFADGSEEYLKMIQENCVDLLKAGPGAPVYDPKILINAKRERLQIKTMLLLELVKRDSFDVNELYKSRMEAAMGFRFCLDLKAAGLILLSADGRTVRRTT